ncbi:hypothetical protein [uncultured Microbacterium sp.]|uniref:hypothetical protein n=1 Tax=uncultured Microbacterium sp. TaxID=191216 RepID=UPI0025E250E2|nr:hypothetical protein [uncultured Microbacterium sp.]
MTTITREDAESALADLVATVMDADALHLEDGHTLRASALYIDASLRINAMSVEAVRQVLAEAVEHLAREFAA